MALWACTDASYLSRPKSGSVAGCSVGLGFSTHPQKVEDKVSERNSPSSVPSASSNHTLPTHFLPPLPTMHPSTPSASAYLWWLHLWRRRSMPRLLVVGKCWLSCRSPSPTLATPNSPLPFYSSTANARLVLRLLRFARRSPS